MQICKNEPSKDFCSETDYFVVLGPFRYELSEDLGGGGKFFVSRKVILGAPQGHMTPKSKIAYNSLINQEGSRFWCPYIGFLGQGIHLCYF